MDSEQFEILADSYPVRTKCAMTDPQHLLKTQMAHEKKEITRYHKRLQK